jgi:hypothetical protein
MATVHVSNSGARLRNAATDEVSGAPAPSPSGPQMLLGVGRRLLGVVLLLLGIMMNFTLVLLPVGVPLALFAVALIAGLGDP